MQKTVILSKNFQEILLHIKLKYTDMSITLGKSFIMKYNNRIIHFVKYVLKTQIHSGFWRLGEHAIQAHLGNIILGAVQK